MDNYYENSKQNFVDFSTQTAKKLMKYNPNQTYNISTSKYNEMNDFDFDLDDLQVDNSAPANENLIKILESKVNQLKKESMEHVSKLQQTDSQLKRYNIYTDDVEEPKVSTQFFAADEDRVQAFKHVQTFQKPEYMSLEELRKEREENERRLRDLENNYYGRSTSQYKTKRRSRSKSAKPVIQREGYTKPEPLDNYDKGFITKYEEYLARKNERSKLDYEEEWNTTKVKSQNANGIVNRKDGLPGYLDQDDYQMYYYNIMNEDKKKPKFERPLVTHKHRGKENTLARTFRNEPDYETKRSFYTTEKSSEKSKTFPQKKTNPNNMIKTISSSFSKGKLRQSELTRSASNNPRYNFKKQKEGPSQSQIAFIKMIFTMLNKTSKGDAPKKTIPADMKLDDKMIKELGFSDKIDFNRKLNNYPTAIPNYMNEAEFTSFLLNKGNPNQDKKDVEFYVLKNKDKIKSFSKTDENIQYVKKEQNDNNNMNTVTSHNMNSIADFYDNDLPGMKTNTFDFLEKESTKERLRSLRTSLRESRSKSPKGNVLSTSLPTYQSGLKMSKGFETFDKKTSTSNQFNQQTFKNSVQFEDMANYKTNELENIQEVNKENDISNHNNSNNNIHPIEKKVTIVNESNNVIPEQQKNYERNDNQGFQYNDDNYIDYTNDNPNLNLRQSNEGFNPNRSQNDYYDTNPNTRSHSSNYRCKTDLNFTIPKPFEFLKRDYHEKKLQKIQEILEARQQYEDSIFKNQFRANPLNRKMFQGSLDNIIEREKKERKSRTEKLQKEIIENMKPFSFYDIDEKKYKEKLKKTCEPPQFVPFKANPIKWKSQVNMYDGIMKNEKELRQQRISERALATYNAARLPPRMEMHEKNKKIQENEMKLIEEQKKKTIKNEPQFKAKEIPDFIRLQEQFQTNLEKKKKAAQPTVPKPFTFHEPKKKAELCEFLDYENDPQAKNPQNRKDINAIIRKMQKKPAIEPATTKGLSLLMETRRKEIEARKKAEEQQKYEDEQRKIKQDRLKERVQKSKDLVDNRKQLEKARKEKLKSSKMDNIAKKKEYNDKLREMNQRINNRPLMLETIGKKPNKIEMGQDYQKEIEKIIEEGIKEREQQQKEQEEQKKEVVKA